jgi:hypothetical protein
MSLVAEDALMLNTELASPGVELVLKGMEMPEIDDAVEACPLRVKSKSVWLEDGRRSGNSAFTTVMMSRGDMMRNGCTSLVSLGDVTAFAGSRMGRGFVRGCRRRTSKFSM